MRLIDSLLCNTKTMEANSTTKEYKESRVGIKLRVVQMMTINQCANCLNNPSQKSIASHPSTNRVLYFLDGLHWHPHQTKKKKEDKQTKQQERSEQRGITSTSRRAIRGTRQIVSIILYFGFIIIIIIVCLDSHFSLCAKTSLVQTPCDLSYSLLARAAIEMRTRRDHQTCWQDKDSLNYLLLDAATFLG